MTDVSESIEAQLESWAAELERRSHAEPRPALARRVAVAVAVVATASAALVALVFAMGRDDTEYLSTAPVPSTATPTTTPSSTTPPPTPPAGAVRRDSMFVMSTQTGIRSDPVDGTIVVSFVGAAPFVAGNACTAWYRAVASEAPDLVSIAIETFTADVPLEGTACNAMGFGRTVTADLQAPLGDRRLQINGKEARVTYDRALLAEPAAASEWTLVDEGPLVSVPGIAPNWSRTWSLGDWPASACGGLPHFTLFEGDVAMLDSFPGDELELSGEIAVGPFVAEDGIDAKKSARYLVWNDGDRAFVAGAPLACSGPAADSTDTLAAFANAFYP